MITIVQLRLYCYCGFVGTSYAFPHYGIILANIKLCVIGVINVSIEVGGHHGQFIDHVLQSGCVHTGLMEISCKLSKRSGELMARHQRSELVKNGDERTRSCPARACVFQSFTNRRNDEEKMNVPSGNQGNAAHI